MTKPANAIRAQRTSVMLRADVFRRQSAEATQHRVSNLSETGMCVAPADGLAADSVVAVSIGAVDPVAADVVWVRKGQAGLRFRAPIDLALARQRRTRGAASLPLSGWLADLDNPYYEGQP